MDRLEGETTIGGELPTDALDLLTRLHGEEVGFGPHLAIGRPAGVPLPDQLVRTSLEGLTCLGPEPGRRQRTATSAHELAIEPGCAVAGHLPVEVVSAE